MARIGPQCHGEEKKIYIYLGYNVPFSANKLHLMFIIPWKLGICRDV